MLEGQVIWTGRSSMDILMRIFPRGPDPRPALSAIFTFVSRDPLDPTKALEVNPITPTTDEVRKSASSYRHRVAGRVHGQESLARRNGGSAGRGRRLRTHEKPFARPGQRLPARPSPPASRMPGW